MSLLSAEAKMNGCAVAESSDLLHRLPPVPHRSWFCIGAILVKIVGDQASDVKLVSSLLPFRAAQGASDVCIHVERVRSLPPASGRRAFDSGTTWRLYESERGFQFDFEAAIFGERPFKRLLIDEHLTEATLQISDECAAILGHSVEPMGYPLDELLIMHRLTQEKAIELHGSGIVRANGVGNLFVGHSGAGKSTTTRLWTEREDVEVLSDDRIIVRRDESAVETPRHATSAASKHEVPSTSSGQALRLPDRSASRTGQFAQDDKEGCGMRMYGTPWHGEAMYASPGSAPLSRIFILEHGHGNLVRRLSPSQAVAELFARSFVPFHRHEYVDSALEFLQELVGAVPVYHYAFEPTAAAVERILEFRD
jgi:hypothetical protein